MNRWLLVIASAVVVTLLSGLYGCSQNERYHIESTSKELLYKIDRKTGKVWVIFGGREQLIKGAKADTEPESPEDMAIDLAKKSKALGGSHVVDVAIRMMLEKRKGKLSIDGWKSEKKDSQVYMVSYTFDDGSGKKGFFFEVNLAAKIVRSILGDLELEKKYGLEEFGKRMRLKSLDSTLFQKGI